ncbi:YokU family protein [Aneurinibacillus sp. REN35]|uniref:YokU family protein n=1 Tax=Aneurinibacillus sp. REN35 TaxID=3237286 RepID=UPI003527594A
MKCIWCETEEAKEGRLDCYWVTPDGKATVQIQSIPSVDCPNCYDKFVPEDTSQKIEDALYLNDISSLGAAFTYEQLLQAPRINLFNAKSQ